MNLQVMNAIEMIAYEMKGSPEDISEIERLGEEDRAIVERLLYLGRLWSSENPDFDVQLEASTEVVKKHWVTILEFIDDDAVEW